ncbi:MAG TPA: hypothetical protein VK152_05160 [Paludibacter sp.]|nr:hypothetical protein [Paludibacter sp.]
MLFEKDHIYHIYNQGNNRQNIFFNKDNHVFFLRKIKEFILPYADIMAWCLMPNHFHWMVYVKETTICIDSDNFDSRGATMSRTPTQATFNKSIGILLASYTRAINKQENRSGSLFRDKTKAECLTQMNGITPSFYNTSNGASIIIPNHEKEYPQVCFNYIHQNPVKAGLVKEAEEWEFSSFQDICGLRNGKLINRDRINEFGLILS